MTFLELVKEVARLGGVAGNEGPTTVVRQRGEFQRIVNLVQLAYEEVANLNADWDFLWAHGSYDVEPGLALYPAPDDLATWHVERVYLDGSPLPVIGWPDYHPESVSPGRPYQAVRRPDNQLLLVPEPDAAHHLTFDYSRRAAPLQGDEDVPLIPARFRRIIVGRALIMLGNYENAPDVKEQGAEMYAVYLDQLERHQLGRRQQAASRAEGVPITVTAQ